MNGIQAFFRPSILQLSLVLLLLGGLLVPTTALSQSTSSLKQKQNQLYSKRKQLRQKRQSKIRQARRYESELVQNQRELYQSKQALGVQQAQLISTQTRIQDLESKLDETTGKTARLSEEAGKRLKHLYMGERLSLLQMLLDAGSLSTLLDRLYYKQKIVANDKQVLDDLMSVSKELASNKKELLDQRQLIGKTISTIEQQQSKIALQAEENRRLKNKYWNDAKYYERLEKQLLAESARITSQLRSMKTGNLGTSRATGGWIWPLRGTITSPFGWRRHPIHRKRLRHTGIDIARPSGTPIKATNSGRIFFAGWRGGYGRAVIVNHGKVKGKSVASLYGHMSRLAVRKGQYVKKGQVIGYVGSTGHSTGPHLHFEMRENGVPVNPRRYVR